jgi:ppGpp synthetase/RelA/SpoT-type nucleotidyltranferase/Flp pilus assembly protein TadD
MARAIADFSRTLAAYEKNRNAYHTVLRGFHRRVRALLAKQGLHPTITYRVKGFDSYLAKLAQLRKAQVDGPIIVRDLLGLRIVCSFLDETERVQDLLVKHFPIVEVERKGVGRSIAEFGYESVHLLVRLKKQAQSKLLPHTRWLCEVQVRTVLQDAWAQIEHELVYKADPSVPKSAIRRKLAAVSATLTLADVIFQEVRDDVTELHEHGDRRRQSVQALVLADGEKPIAASAREISRFARPDRTLRDPRSRDLESLIVRALQAHGANELEKAIQLYSRVLRQRLPNTTIRSMIYNHRGIAHLTLSRPDRAMRDFASAVRWDPGNSRAYYNRGLSYRAMAKPRMALREFRRAAAAGGVEANAHYAIAQVLVDLGRYREARVECEEALALNRNLQGARALKERLQTTWDRDRGSA